MCDCSRLTKLRSAYQICKFDFLKKYRISEPEWDNSHKVIEHLNIVSLEREDIFQSCNWKKQPINCSKFKRVITRNGYCYTFNMLNSRDIFTDK